MSNKKIGIITHYYCSKNYGGNLQAYALCKVIHDLGYDVEQICYKRWEDPPLWHKKKNFGFLVRCVKRLFCISSRMLQVFHPVANQKIKKREQCILSFNCDFIPHSKKDYSYQTICDANQDYDVFITGSDQVWHPQAVCKAFLLDFVEKNKAKISYAASISVNELSEEQKMKYQQSFSDYNAISVREENAVDLLRTITPIIPQWVLDPTMLLSQKQWDDICTPRKIPEPYIFCYFLGDDSCHRKIAETYAYVKGLKIVTLPYLMGRYRKCDYRFGDEKLYDVSPAEYISLIKFADVILTDSFHATVFSLLYQREFFSFDRRKSKGMGSRLHSLTSLFGLEERFCDTPEKTSISYISSLKPIDYTRSFENFQFMKTKSLEFLQNSIDNA